MFANIRIKIISKELENMTICVTVYQFASAGFIFKDSDFFLTFVLGIFCPLAFLITTVPLTV